MSINNDGKSAEEIVRKALLLMQEKRRATFVRLYDTTSAGNFLPGQPGDFILHVEGVGCLLEVKSSSKHPSLNSVTLRDTFSIEQIKGARLWLRAGAVSLCLFHRVGTKTVEVWGMQDVVGAYLSPPRQRKLKGDPLAVLPTEALGLVTGLVNTIKNQEI